jgi:hypothetical protein
VAGRFDTKKRQAQLDRATLVCPTEPKPQCVNNVN